LKAFLSSSPVIQKPNATEPITIYLIILEEAINTTLVQEVEKDEQPIYFISRVEIRYQMIEKVVLDLVITTRRMHRYFQNHCIVVKNDYPIKKILVKPDFA